MMTIDDDCCCLIDCNVIAILFVPSSLILLLLYFVYLTLSPKIQNFVMALPELRWSYFFALAMIVAMVVVFDCGVGSGFIVEFG